MLLEQDLWEILVCQWQCSYKLYNSAIWENSWLALMKNTIYLANNVNLILNTYRCLFFETDTENRRVTRREGGAEVSPALFQNSRKSTLEKLWKKMP